MEMTAHTVFGLLDWKDVCTGVSRFEGDGEVVVT